MHPTVARPALLAGLYLLCAGAWLLVWGLGAVSVCGLVLFSALKSARDALRQSEIRYQQLLERLGRTTPEGRSSDGGPA
jgi:hypothetical protein